MYKIVTDPHDPDGDYLTWTTKPPTEPGWYWAQWRDGTRSIVQVEWMLSELLFTQTGDNMPHKLTGAWTPVLWLGPLPVPEPPKESEQG